MVKITESECTEVLRRNARFVALCDNYRTLCETNDFPVSVDMKLLATVYRTQLFQQLLAVDKGLKARYEMLRTDAAKLKLITDTIDLSGYDILDTLESEIDLMELAYQQIWVSSLHLHRNISFSIFCEKTGLNLSTLLTGWVINWEGREHILTYFRELAPLLENMREMHRSIISTGFTLADTLAVIGSTYTQDSQRETLVADEKKVHQLADSLEKAGKLAAFKK